MLSFVKRDPANRLSASYQHFKIESNGKNSKQPSQYSACRIAMSKVSVHNIILFEHAVYLVQKISPPNKDKIQLQILMHNDDQATFVFMKPGAKKEDLVADRELIKETIQQALVRYRQLQNSARRTLCIFRHFSWTLQEQQRTAKTQNNLADAKTNYLKENKDLQLLYRYLVASKMLSNEDFWSVHQVPVVSWRDDHTEAEITMSCRRTKSILAYQQAFWTQSAKPRRTMCV